MKTKTKTKKKFIDAGSGRFVSKKFASENAKTTVGLAPKRRVK